MEKILSISEFASIFGVSRRTLLYYDQIGLFSPIHSAKENGYRQYDFSQVVNFEHIMSMKEAGFTLQQIQKCMAKKTPTQFIDWNEQQYHSLSEKIDSLYMTQKKILNNIRELKQYRNQPNKAQPFLFEIEEDIPVFFIENEKMGDFAAIYRTLFTEIRKRNISLRFSVANRFESIAGGLFEKQDFFFFEDYSMDSATFDCISAGTYIAIYNIGPFYTNPQTYKKFFDYLCEYRIPVTGMFYENGVIGPHCSTNEEEYVIKIFIKLDGDIQKLPPIISTIS